MYSRLDVSIGGVHSRIPSGCLKAQLVLNPAYTMGKKISICIHAFNELLPFHLQGTFYSLVVVYLNYQPSMVSYALESQDLITEPNEIMNSQLA